MPAIYILWIMKTLIIMNRYLTIHLGKKMIQTRHKIHFKLNKILFMSL